MLALRPTCNTIFTKVIFVIFDHEHFAKRALDLRAFFLSNFTGLIDHPINKIIVFLKQLVVHQL